MDYIRAKQIGIQHDLTDLLSSEDLYVIDEVSSPPSLPFRLLPVTAPRSSPSLHLIPL